MPPTGVIAAVVAVAAVALLGRLTFRTWLHPGAFFALVWLFLLAFSLSAPLFGQEQLPVWEGAIWWIALTLACVYAGSVLGMRMAAPPVQAAAVPSSGRDFPWVTPLLVITAISSVVWPIAVPANVAWGDHPPMYLQVFLGLHYVGPLLAGLLYGGARDTRSRVLALLMLLPGLFFGVLDTGRTKVVLQFSYWFTGYFTMLVFVNRRRIVPLFTAARTSAAIACVTLFLVVGVVFTQFRSVPRDVPVGDKLRQYWQLLEPDRLLDSWDWMHSSIFGHPAMFSSYFELAWDTPPVHPKFPAETAAGLYRAMGYELPEPLYTMVGGELTNVFTIFKPPIEDFTLPGALLIFCAWGALSAWSYARLQGGSLWPGVFLIHFYANATNIGGTFLTYNSQTGAFMLVGLYLWYLERTALRPRASTVGATRPEAPARAVWGAPRLSESHR